MCFYGKVLTLLRAKKVHKTEVANTVTSRPGYGYCLFSNCNRVPGIRNGSLILSKYATPSNCYKNLTSVLTLRNKFSSEGQTTGTVPIYIC